MQQTFQTELFDKSYIEDHASSCTSFPQPTTKREKRESHVTQLANEVQASGVTDVSHIDCSENSCLSKQEQEYWKNYARLVKKCYQLYFSCKKGPFRF